MQFIPKPDQSRLRLATRSVAVSATNKDIIKEIRERGIPLTPAQYSLAINGVSYDPKSDIIVKHADEIVSEWEQQIISEYGEKALLYNPKKTTA